MHHLLEACCLMLTAGSAYGATSSPNSKQDKWSPERPKRIRFYDMLKMRTGAVSAVFVLPTGLYSTTGKKLEQALEL